MAGLDYIEGEKKMNFQRLFVTAFVFVFVTMMAVGSGAAAVCSNASLNGVVGFVTTAWTAGVGIGGASVGQLTFDGKGNFSAVAIDSAFGTIGPDDFSGTYSIGKDCTGTLNITSPDQHTFNIVLDDMRKGFLLIETDGVYIASAFGIPQGTVTCGLTGKKQTFAISLAGTAVGVGPVVAVGQMTLDGKGGLTGKTTFNLNGTVISGSMTGSYTANSSCNGTAQMTVDGLTTNYYVVIVNSTKELLVIETDSGTVVTGTFQE